MPANYEKLKGLLRELFQMDQADLDFGIFRIMNAKRDEIERFLEDDLLPQVQEELARHIRADGGVKRVELEEAIEKAKAIGVDPDQVPRVLELREQVKQGTDLAALENEVFSHLYNFFRRYYDQGDFLSLRRYKEGVYAIPYEGEEVKLYWANHDQYYIKSSEYLRNYAFKLPDGRRVHFKVAEADAEADNNKPQAGKERRFILADPEPVIVTEGELTIRFEYRALDRKQSELNGEAVAAILGDGNLGAWRMALAEARPTEKNKQRTLLEKHLSDFTAKNTFDYFIHKDLGGFLRRELDFFIKNEIMHLDDVEDEAAPKVELYLSKIKALRKIAHKLIAFLDQLETFQKKLWLKKKFVVEANYCVTLDRVPEKLYPQIIENKAQIEEWKRCCLIDKIERTTVALGYTEPLTVEFLKENQSLMVDTCFFSGDFKTALVASLNQDSLDGIVVQSDNFPALQLLQKGFSGRVRAFYLDPPYNTGGDGFVYKDGYQHASWITMVRDRLQAARVIADATTVFSVSIDENEVVNLRRLLTDYGFFEIGVVVIQNNPKGRVLDKSLATCHEYLIFFAKKAELILQGVQKTDEEIAQDYTESDSNGRFRLLELRNTHREFNRQTRANLWYPLYVETTTKAVFLDPAPNRVEVWPTWDDGFEGCWTWGRELAHEDGRLLRAEIIKGKWKVYRKAYAQSEDGETVRKKPKTIWVEKQFQTEKGQSALDSLFGAQVFRSPKPVELVRMAIAVAPSQSDWVCDFFAGSGTTGHAVLQTNREGKDTKLKFLLMDMGEHVRSVVLPRLKKVVYSHDWRDGLPVSRQGLSSAFRYLNLESYEDCLNNLELKRTKTQDDLLTHTPEFREDYMLRYMLDVESQGSASLLNVQKFTDPFG